MPKVFELIGNLTLTVKEVSISLILDLLSALVEAADIVSLTILKKAKLKF